MQVDPLVSMSVPDLSAACCWTHAVEVLYMVLLRGAIDAFLKSLCYRGCCILRERSHVYCG